MVGMGKKVGITKIDKRGRATIPQEIRRGLWVETRSGTFGGEKN